MWTRRELKEKAKAALGRNYWKIMLVAALAVVFSGGAGYASGTSSSVSSDVAGVVAKGTVATISEAGEEQDDFFAVVIPEELPADETAKTEHAGFDYGTQRTVYFVTVAVALIVIFVIFASVVVALVMLLYNPFYVGMQRFMLKSVDDRAQMKEVAYGFDHSYRNVVKTMFHRDLQVFLWAILLIIPGIYKKYQYRMVSYILAEHPDMDYREVLQMSKDMMEGEKWNALVLDLSFIPWHLLGMITCGMVELFYVSPYYYLTDAALYRRISTKDVAVD